MATGNLNEIFSVASNKELSEVGGGHNQKGIEFQRHWALMRMFELEENGDNDFLFLFEAIQDVAELNSCEHPTSIRIYQVKKKDRKEWTWSELTGLFAPNNSGKNSTPKISSLEKVKCSPLGKLYANVIAFNGVTTEGRFISNRGCDIPLSDGSNAATSLPCNMSLLSESHRDLLAKGLASLQNAGMPTPDLSRIHIVKVALPPDDPGTHLVGVAVRFLESRSKRHAGQARALIDALMAKISPLGAKTDTCKTFEEMRHERGYSRQQFIEALANLEEMPDYYSLLEDLLGQLRHEGMSFMDLSRIRIAATAIFRRQLLGNSSNEQKALLNDCEDWLIHNPLAQNILPLFEKAFVDLKDNHSSFTKAELMAHFALQAIKKCVDQT